MSCDINYINEFIDSISSRIAYNSCFSDEDIDLFVKQISKVTKEKRKEFIKNCFSKLYFWKIVQIKKRENLKILRHDIKNSEINIDRDVFNTTMMAGFDLPKKDERIVLAKMPVNDKGEKSPIFEVIKKVRRADGALFPYEAVCVGLEIGKELDEGEEIFIVTEPFGNDLFRLVNKDGKNYFDMGYYCDLIASFQCDINPDAKAVFAIR